jgi:hypothetical protein
VFEQVFKNIDDVLWKEADCTTDHGQRKLTPLLRLKYQDSFADAVSDLGNLEEIGKDFAGFQKFFYQEAA